MKHRDVPISKRIEHGEFVTLSLIDEGGMGSIIEVEEVQTGRPVALKVMHPEMLNSEEFRERFDLEAKVLARLEHPNIVPLHVRKNDSKGRPFYTMKKVVGKTLQHIISSIRRGDEEMIEEFPLARLITVFYKVCDAIAFAHSRGIVHRDLKPPNIMVGEFGEVLVMDWGLAKVLGEEEREFAATGEPADFEALQDTMEAGSLTLSGGAGALTRDGAVMGTPQFMSPEQALGRISAIDARSDVFALGGILYAMLTLHPPFYGKNVAQILAHVRVADIEDPMIFMHLDAVMQRFPKTPPDFSLKHCPSGRIPPVLAAIMEKAMSEHPDDRYQKLTDLQADIDAWRGGFATTAEEAGVIRRTRLFLARNRTFTMALVAILALAIGFGAKVLIIRSITDAAIQETMLAVPLIAGEAKMMVRQGRFTEAIQHLDHGLALKPNEVKLLEMKGDMYQSLFRFSESIPVYEAALELDQNSMGIRQSLAFSRTMEGLSETAARNSNERLSRFARLLERQNRRAELSILKTIQAKLRQSITADIGDLRRTIRKAGASAGIASRLRYDGTRLVLNLVGVRVSDVSFLADVPIKDLDLSGSGLRSLADLKGLKLERLILKGLQVSDIGPLRGMRLRILDLSGTRVEKIRVLKGMPLQRLDLSDTPITNLEVLAGAPLVVLNINNCSKLVGFDGLPKKTLKSLEVAGTTGIRAESLKGLSLEKLYINGSGVSDLAMLKGMPLVLLNLDGNQVVDLAPLSGMKLRELSLRQTAVSQLDALAGMPLKSLLLSGSQVAELQALAGLPLEILELRNLKLSDLSALSGLPLKTVDLSGSVSITNVAPLGQCLALEQIALPEPANDGKLNLKLIQDLPELKRITRDFAKLGYKWESVDAGAVEEFWEWYADNWGKAFEEK